MMFDFAKPDSLYDALLARDAAYDGRAWVGVSSTGVFCRLTCPARKPKRENCTFFESVGACLEAGYRPCKRCHPIGAAADGDPLVTSLLTALRSDPARRWTEAGIAALGHDPSTVRRAFKRHFGMTFLDMARHERLRIAAKTLRGEGRVIDAQFDAGYDGPRAFREAFARHLGLRPSDLARDARLQADYLDTPLGAMVAVADHRHLYLLEFADRPALPRELKTLWRDAKGNLGLGRTEPMDNVSRQLAGYFAGQSARFDLPLAWGGTTFMAAVWAELQCIPAGQTRSYTDIARAIGRPDAVRAVARANGANRLAIVVPCHRVIGADGALTGYGGGLWRKQKLIELEQHFARKDTR